MLNRTRALSAAAALLLAAGAANAQFLTSITRPVFGVNPPEVFFVDPEGLSTFVMDPLNYPQITYSAPGFSGLAADEANRRFFGSNVFGTTTNIYAIPYDTLEPVFLVNTLRPDGANGPVMDGLAYDSTRNVLYGTRVLGGSTGAEGLYTIDMTTGETALVFEYETTATSNFSIGGIDYDAATDRIYLADEDDTGGRWIYSLDPANLAAGFAEVSPFPAGAADVDGVGAGGGKVFLLTDNAGQNGGTHWIYDLAGGGYTVAPSPYPAPAGSPIAPNPSGGAAYAPTFLDGGEPCAADWSGDGSVNSADISAFLTSWLSSVQMGDLIADFSGDGAVNSGDISAFLTAWLDAVQNGC